MLSAAALRRQIESALEQRIPGALTPRPRAVRDLAATGVHELDVLLEGGLPIGAITELVGPQCSGRTTLALAHLAELTSAGKVVAWVDVSDALDPESAAAAGVDLSRQLWVRCGNTTSTTHPPDDASLTNLHPIPGPPLLVEGCLTPAPSGGGGSPHPRGEAHGLSQAIGAFMQPDTFARAITPRESNAARATTRKNRVVGTPGAPNRKLTDSPQTGHGNPLPHRAADRNEQIPTDRLPPRRTANLSDPQRRPKNLSAAQIAYTGKVAGAWNDNRNNAAGRALKSAPSDIAATLPRLSDMEARAMGQGHGIERGPFDWKPSIAHLRPVSPATSSTTRPRHASSLAGEPPRLMGKASSPLWKCLDQALRATDLLLAAGGFSAIVLDLGSIPPEIAWRIPLATWFRFRAAAERSRTVLLLLTQHPCARSSAELVLRLNSAQPQTASETPETVLTGAHFHIAIDRRRFETPPAAAKPSHPTAEEPSDKLHLVSLRKPPQRASAERATAWHRPTAWARGG